jgi:hypothetical protein
VPDWQPNWEDVVFDHAAAQAAIDQCQLSAGALDTGFTGVGQAAMTLAASGAWTGSYRVEYDDAMGTLSTDAGDTAGDLRKLAAAIATAANKAETEQAERERDRARWRQEKDAEDEARRARRPRGGQLP